MTQAQHNIGRVSPTRQNTCKVCKPNPNVRIVYDSDNLVIRIYYSELHIPTHNTLILLQASITYKSAKQQIYLALPL